RCARGGPPHRGRPPRPRVRPAVHGGAARGRLTRTVLPSDGHRCRRQWAAGTPTRHPGAVETLPLRSARGRWVVLAATLASAIAFLDGTVVNVALRPIALDLGATLVDLQWVVN